jgi:hypothetical protein
VLLWIHMLLVLAERRLYETMSAQHVLATLAVVTCAYMCDVNRHLTLAN